MATKIKAAGLVDWLAPHADSNAPEGQWGYIMGGKGQSPKTLSSWYFNQYQGKAAEYAKALYWREHAERVLDCNGAAEGYYELITGVDINTKARSNFAIWCAGNNGRSMAKLPKVKGAAVFVDSASAGYITHVGFLEKPVKDSAPNGDWWVLEARGVLYGLVRTKLSARPWNCWGLMTKYFNYEAYAAPVYKLGQRLLELNMTGDDVEELQTALISLGFSCGSWGADSDFGPATDAAMRAFQSAHKLVVDGQYGPKSHAALVVAVEAQEAHPALTYTYTLTTPDKALLDALKAAHGGTIISN
ncbi:MAG: peptidoglycan-binding domain-containing protein [Kiritimatiellales bacterium]